MTGQGPKNLNSRDKGRGGAEERHPGCSQGSELQGSAGEPTMAPGDQGTLQGLPGPEISGAKDCSMAQGGKPAEPSWCNTAHEQAGVPITSTAFPPPGAHCPCPTCSGPGFSDQQKHLYLSKCCVSSWLHPCDLYKPSAEPPCHHLLP